MTKQAFLASAASIALLIGRLGVLADRPPPPLLDLPGRTATSHDHDASPVFTDGSSHATALRDTVMDGPSSFEQQMELVLRTMPNTTYNKWWTLPTWLQNATLNPVTGDIAAVDHLRQRLYVVSPSNVAVLAAIMADGSDDNGRGLANFVWEQRVPYVKLTGVTVGAPVFKQYGKDMFYFIAMGKFGRQAVLWQINASGPPYAILHTYTVEQSTLDLQTASRTRDDDDPYVYVLDYYMAVDVRLGRLVQINGYSLTRAAGKTLHIAPDGQYGFLYESGAAHRVTLIRKAAGIGPQWGSTVRMPSSDTAFWRSLPVCGDSTYFMLGDKVLSMHKLFAPPVHVMRDFEILAVLSQYPYLLGWDRRPGRNYQVVALSTDTWQVVETRTTPHIAHPTCHNTTGKPSRMLVDESRMKLTIICGDRHVLQISLTDLLTSDPYPCCDIELPTGEKAFLVAGQALAIAIQASDSRIKLDLRKAPLGMVRDNVTGTVTWTPTWDQVGDHTIAGVARFRGPPYRNFSFNLTVLPSPIQLPFLAQRLQFDCTSSQLAVYSSNGLDASDIAVVSTSGPYPKGPITSKHFTFGFTDLVACDNYLAVLTQHDYQQRVFEVNIFHVATFLRAKTLRIPMDTTSTNEARLEATRDALKIIQYQNSKRLSTRAYSWVTFEHMALDTRQHVQRYHAPTNRYVLPYGGSYREGNLNDGILYNLNDNDGAPIAVLQPGLLTIGRLMTGDTSAWLHSIHGKYPYQPILSVRNNVWAQCEVVWNAADLRREVIVWFTDGRNNVIGREVAIRRIFASAKEFSAGQSAYSSIKPQLVLHSQSNSSYIAFGNEMVNIPWRDMKARNTLEDNAKRFILGLDPSGHRIFIPNNGIHKLTYSRDGGTPPFEYFDVSVGVPPGIVRVDAATGDVHVDGKAFHAAAIIAANNGVQTETQLRITTVDAMEPWRRVHTASDSNSTVPVSLAIKVRGVDGNAESCVVAHYVYTTVALAELAVVARLQQKVPAPVAFKSPPAPTASSSAKPSDFPSSPVKMTKRRSREKYFFLSFLQGLFPMLIFVAAVPILIIIKRLFDRTMQASHRLGRYCDAASSRRQRWFHRRRATAWLLFRGQCNPFIQNGRTDDTSTSTTGTVQPPNPTGRSAATQNVHQRHVRTPAASATIPASDGAVPDAALTLSL